jgi:hypothetical protein
MPDMWSALNSHFLQRGTEGSQALLWFGFEILLKGLCDEGLVPNATMFRGGILGSDYIMRALTSPMY